MAQERKNVATDVSRAAQDAEKARRERLYGALSSFDRMARAGPMRKGLGMEIRKMAPPPSPLLISTII